MRSRILAVAAVLLLGAACSDAPVATDASSGQASLQIAPPNGALDNAIYSLFQLYPNGLSNAGLNRWTTAKRAYESGKIDQARNHVSSLAEWVADQAPRMGAPPSSESRASAAARLALYMALYIYEGPGTQIPENVRGGDNVVGIVTPARGGTVVTPARRAGVAVPRGAVNVNTIIVITENLNPYPAPCSGPLPTQRCQYPRFYHFAQFPHERLNEGATFAVCHVNSGKNRRQLPGSDHDRWKLAHQAPRDPANKTPGSTLVDGIEILPLAHQDFTVCKGIEYALNAPTGLDLVLARAASAITEFITPKSAWAIDQGGGGMGFEFSDFNHVDPDGRPDNGVSAVSVSPNIEGPPTVNFTVANGGTATSRNVPFQITLTPLDGDGNPQPITWMSGDVPGLVPLESSARTSTGFLPDIGAGRYTLTVNVGSNKDFPDSNLENNSASIVYTVGGVINKLGKKPIGR